MQQVDFKISLGSVSKAVASLEEQLGVRRRGTAVIVAEPVRLLQQWGEKYKERYRWRLRSSFQTGNPFGRDLAAIAEGIGPLIQGAYAFSGAIAAASDAPFVDIDLVDIFVLNGEREAELRDLKSQPNTGPNWGNRPAWRWHRLRSGTWSGGGFRHGSGYGSGLHPASFHHALRCRCIHVFEAGRNGAGRLADPSLFGSLRARRT